MAEAKKEAQNSIKLMQERYQRILNEEINKSGLVILVALYGKLIDNGKRIIIYHYQIFAKITYICFRYTRNHG